MISKVDFCIYSGMSPKIVALNLSRFEVIFRINSSVSSCVH